MDTSYKIDELLTTDQGTLIALRKEWQNPQGPESPDIIKIYDKDKDGLDQGDEVISYYDLYAHHDSYSELNGLLEELRRGNPLPRKIKGEQVVGTIIDGGFSTKRTITGNDIKKWKAWLNPFLKMARDHREIMQKSGLQITEGECTEVIPDFPPTIRDGLLLFVGEQTTVRFDLPLSLDTRRPHKTLKYYEDILPGTWVDPLAYIRDPNKCEEARGTKEINLGGKKVEVKMSTSTPWPAISASNVIPQIVDREGADVEYEWSDPSRYAPDVSMIHINLK